MAKKNNNIWLWIIGIIAVVYLLPNTGLFSAADVGSADVYRTINKNEVTVGDQFKVTYEARNTGSGKWGTLIEDSNTKASPSTYRTGWLSTESNSITKTYVAEEVGTCSFSGNYQFADSQEKSIVGENSITIIPKQSTWEIYDLDAPTNIDEGTNPKITVRIKNTGDVRESINVEAFYVAESNHWYDDYTGSAGGNTFSFLGYGGVNEIESCKSSEDFVQAVKLDQLDSGEEITFKMNPATPTSGSKFDDGSVNYDSNGNYLLFIGAYRDCDQGHASAASKEVGIYDCNGLKSTAQQEISTWANSPTSSNKNDALNAITNWARKC